MENEIESFLPSSKEILPRKKPHRYETDLPCEQVSPGEPFFGIVYRPQIYLRGRSRRIMKENCTAESGT